jgi:hypothetical protein
MPIYMKIGGNNVACEEVHFDTPGPRDPSSGQASGKRQWGQVKILHGVDSSTQALESLVKNQGFSSNTLNLIWLPSDYVDARQRRQSGRRRLALKRTQFLNGSMP